MTIATTLLFLEAIPSFIFWGRERVGVMTITTTLLLLEAIPSVLFWERGRMVAMTMTRMNQVKVMTKPPSSS